MVSTRGNTAAQWTDPEWRSEAELWIRRQVAQLGLSLGGEIEQPHAFPWSTVMRVPTANGVIWFKACSRELAYEVPLVALLASRGSARVLGPLASDAGRGWMLLPDAGRRLRDLELNLQLERWPEALALYAQLQLDVSADVDAFVAAGVPDRRPPLLAEQLERVLADDAMLKPAHEAALSNEEIVHARELVTSIDREQRELQELGVPDSIQHDDLHDANIYFREGGGYTFIDWGDAYVAHPFFTLSVTLAVLADHLGVARDATELNPFRDAYLEPWEAFQPRDELVAAVPSALRVGYAAGTTKWYDVISSMATEERRRFADGIPARVRRLLTLCA